MYEEVGGDEGGVSVMGGVGLSGVRDLLTQGK